MAYISSICAISNQVNMYRKPTKRNMWLPLPTSESQLTVILTSLIILVDLKKKKNMHTIIFTCSEWHEGN